MTDYDLNLARKRRSQGLGLTNTEIRALHDADRVPRRPVPTTNWVNGKIVNQLNDRTHTLVPRYVQDNQTQSQSSIKLPFQPVFSGTSTTITYGTLNGVAPTNIGSTFSVPTSGTRYLVLTGSSSNGSVTSSSLSVTTTPPTMVAATYGFPPATFTVLLYVIVNQTLFRIIGPGSLYALPKESFRVQKSMPTPDLLPYDSYYNWLVSNV